ncbi:MAG: A/G-specific adenine glycosylase [Candidatus Omnitrophica bacterium]|nr:A/G-specific adenine glycosylase [Candidatus Omnitrophota bacterium]
MPRSFALNLLTWYNKHKRDLPWRRTKDPYHIWVSEIMLQQTTVNAVIPYYQGWIKTYPTVFDLARAPLQKVLKSWQGLGYYNRAKNLHKAAAIVASNYQGQLPQEAHLVRHLPGFGPYTTGSVLSIAYDKPLVIIDANVRRLVMRLLAVKARADTRQDKTIEHFLNKVLPSQRAGDFNQALMEIGALVCRHKEPLCSLCPLKKFCKAYALGLQEIIPTPQKKIIQDIHGVIAIIERQGKYLIQKRPSSGLLADLWEFPGGKIKPGENKTRALARELKEELNVELKRVKHLFDLKHFYTQFRVNLSVFACQLKSYPAAQTKKKWVKSSDFAQYPMPSGSAKIVDRLFNPSPSGFRMTLGARNSKKLATKSQKT